MRLHVKENEDTGDNELFRIDKYGNLGKLVLQINYLNPGHEACCLPL